MITSMQMEAATTNLNWSSLSTTTTLSGIFLHGWMVIVGYDEITIVVLILIHFSVISFLFPSPTFSFSNLDHYALRLRLRLPRYLLPAKLLEKGK